MYRYVILHKYMYLESQSTLEYGYMYLPLWSHVPFSKVLWSPGMFQMPTLFTLAIYERQIGPSTRVCL